MSWSFEWTTTWLSFISRTSTNTRFPYLLTLSGLEINTIVYGEPNLLATSSANVRFTNRLVNLINSYQSTLCIESYKFDTSSCHYVDQDMLLLRCPSLPRSIIRYCLSPPGSINRYWLTPPRSIKRYCLTPPRSTNRCFLTPPRIIKWYNLSQEYMSSSKMKGNLMKC